MTNLFWNENPGVFVNKETGKIFTMPPGYDGPLWEGHDDEWVETLFETCVDASKSATALDLGAGYDGLKLITNQKCADKLKLSVMSLFGLDVVVDSAVTSNIINVFFDGVLEGTVTIQS